MIASWGFIGAGYVASRAMAPAVLSTSNAKLYAVASRDAQRSAQLQPEVVHEQYADLLDDPKVDVVYISLTNVQHKEWVLKALNAGKHVVCEKPLAMNATEVQEMMRVAQANNRILVEAVWTRWQPRMRRMADIVQSGTLGEITEISSAFTFQGDLTDNYRSIPELGGGALLDVGCYQAHLWLMLLNEQVDATISSVHRTTGPTGIDLTTELHARLNQSVGAIALSSFDLASRQEISVKGTSATMFTGEGEAFTLWKQQSTLVIGETVETFASDDAFALMVEDISSQILTGSEPCFPTSSSLVVANILDSVQRTESTPPIRG
jgi:predicted dehydrogenase